MKNLKAFDQFAKGKSTNEKRNNSCVIYTRVSTREQAERNLSLETQRKACESYSRKNNYNIMAYFGGTYESAKTDERTEFNNMLSYVKKSREKVSFIIVFSVDRFSRSGGNAIYIADQLKKQGINILSVMQPTDISTPSGILQQNIQFIFSEYDNQLRKEKSKAGMRNKILKGEWCTKPPRGYDSIKVNGKKSLVINEEGQILRKAFIWKYHEGISHKEIVDRLSCMGLNISSARVSNLFRNPFYCGILSTKSLEGKVVHGKHEKLISHELFLAINEQLYKKRRSGTYYYDNPELPLRRVINCGICGDPYTGYCLKDYKLYYYKCHTKGCSSNVSANKVHKQFFKLLTQIGIDEVEYPNLKAQFASKFLEINKICSKNQASFKGQLTVIKNKMEFLEQQYVFKELSAVLFNKHIAKLKDDYHAIESQLEKLQAGFLTKEQRELARNEIMENIASIWLTSNIKIKRLMQATLFPEGLSFDKRTNQFDVQNLAPGFILKQVV